MRYVALIRGIMPSNPNMRNEKLRGLFTELGFTNVRTVISSGNVIFDSPSKNTIALEKKIEDALPRRLSFSSTTIIRSQEDLLVLQKQNPFKNIKDEKPNYLVITFFKNGNSALPTVVDLNKETGAETMRKLEKEYEKLITTRTWKTVGRIIRKMESDL